MLVLNAKSLPLTLKEVNEDEMKDILSRYYGFGNTFYKKLIWVLQQLPYIIFVEGDDDVVRDFHVRGANDDKTTYVWAKDGKGIVKKLSKLDTIHFLIDYTYYPYDGYKTRVEIVHVDNFILDKEMLAEIRKIFIDNILKEL